MPQFCPRSELPTAHKACLPSRPGTRYSRCMMAPPTSAELNNWAALLKGSCRIRARWCDAARRQATAN